LASRSLPGRTSDDASPVEDACLSLARAVRKFATYPASNPQCRQAVAASGAALAALAPEDRLTLRVTSRELIAGDTAVGAGTLIEHELARRLYKARVAVLEISISASSEDLSHLCAELARPQDQSDASQTLADRLTERRVDTIVPTMAQQPVVMDVGVVSATTRARVDRERHRRHATEAHARPAYLYPPGKGWIRVDPFHRVDSVALVDLPALVEDPVDIADLLFGLTDAETPASERRQVALERTFGNLMRILGALEAELAQVMCARLAGAIGSLETNRRRTLLEHTILPAVLDGGPERFVLVAFPDEALADALSLLLELETGGPQAFATVLGRLELSSERRAAVIERIEARLRATDGRVAQAEMERYARALLRLNAAASRDLSDFAAFDLAIDGKTTEAVAQLRVGIGSTDSCGVQLLCLRHLMDLATSPPEFEALLRRMPGLFAELERYARWDDLTAAIDSCTQRLAAMQSTRPEMAEAIGQMLTAYCTPPRLLTRIDWYAGGGPESAPSEAWIVSLGPSMVPAFARLLDDPLIHGRARALVPLMSARASELGAALAKQLPECGAHAARILVGVLGHAGGHVTHLADVVTHADGRVVREALRGLVRIGTPDAVAVVARQIEHGREATRALAEQALLQCPPAAVATVACDLLASRSFVLSNPDLAVRLMERARAAGAPALDERLDALSVLRFRVWHPGSRRVGLKARALRRR
jgi:hypothetical protein